MNICSIALTLMLMVVFLIDVNGCLLIPNPHKYHI